MSQALAAGGMDQWKESDPVGGWYFDIGKQDPDKPAVGHAQSWYVADGLKRQMVDYTSRGSTTTVRGELKKGNLIFVVWGNEGSVINHMMMVTGTYKKTVHHKRVSEVRISQHTSSRNNMKWDDWIKIAHKDHPNPSFDYVKMKKTGGKL